MLHRGDCHCGQVKFEFESNPDIVLYQCNCSICERVGYLHLIIPAGAFKLLTDWDQLSLYTFNTHVAKHYFCKSCGVKPFYVPRSNPDGVSINYRCVDPSTFGNVVVEDFDGQNWEKNAADLSDLSS
ncbi:MAG: GFA family protein [Gammaproteobacteria bacterium]|nr:GFA family protein [Gammaproteobacteria bacterium]MBT4493709.1 GFA family protein [Gammaproteobacteria bacterium]MBT7369091.1 GFA family protein [Gammaproteobacteria bacterium]